MVITGDMRRKLEQAFLELNGLLSGEIPENKDEILVKVEGYRATILGMKQLVEANPELRRGNVLNALMEGDALVGEDGKGLLLEVQRGVEAERGEDVLRLVGVLRQKHELMVKFLEADGKVEGKDA